MLDTTRTYTAQQVHQLVEQLTSDAFGAGQAMAFDFFQWKNHYGIADGSWQSHTALEIPEDYNPRGPRVVYSEEAEVTPEHYEAIKRHIAHQQSYGVNPPVDKSRDEDRITELWNEYGDREAVPLNSDNVEQVMLRREFDIVMKLKS